MPPKGRGGRAASAAAAASGRTSSRIAAKEAQQLAAQAAEAAASASAPPADAPPADAPPPDSSMPPPSAPARGRGRGRGGRGNAENHARRGIPRDSRGGSSFPDFSVAERSTQYSDLLADDNPVHHTPQSADAANRVYGSSYSDALPPTPRTQNATTNLMNKFVERLFASSKDLLSHFAIDAEHRDEAWVHELHTHKEVFRQYYKIYTMDLSPFIEIDAVADKIKSHENETLWQIMAQAIAIANLANLFCEVDDLDSDPKNVYDRLPIVLRIDDYFPAAFVPGAIDNLHHWMVDGATVELAFAIRTQRFIETLRVSPPHVNGLRLLVKVFLDIDVDSMTDEVLAQHISEAGYRPFGGFDINAPEAQQYRDKIREFQDMLTHMQKDAVINKLEGDNGQHQFELFLAGMKDWIAASASKLPGPLRPNPLFTYSRDSPYSPGAQLQAEEASAPRFAASGIKALQRLASGTATQQGHDDSDFMDDDAPYHSIDDQSLAGTNLEIYNIAREQANMLMAENAGAMYAAAAAQAMTGGTGRKRGRKNANDGNSNAKRARDAAAMPAPMAATPAPALDPNAPPGSAPTAFDPLALSEAAQLITKANRRPTVPKARRPWTVHDTQQLVTAIDVYKAKWSTIEKAIKGGHIAFNVIERDQQGLRDKARLVKVDILKTDAPLPPSFDLVVLGKKEKDMVISAGKNPHRREADVDAAGQPINTIYNPNAPPPPPPQAQSQPAPDIVMEDVVEDPEAHDLRPLQEEAQLAMESHMRSGGGGGGGGAPDAPMMPADMGEQHHAHISDSLGEGMAATNPNDAPPIDPSMSTAASESDIPPI